MAAPTRAFATSLYSLVDHLNRRHEGHHDDEEGEEETAEEIRERLDSFRNHAAASIFWYAIIALLILGLALRLVRSLSASLPILKRVPSLPSPVLSISQWWRLHPWPLSKIAIIVLYALFVVSLITVNAIDHDETYLDRLGYRAAWVSTTQPTLVFLLAARLNPIGLVIGTSYERVNWLHRWAARILLGSVTVHGSFFLAKWLPAGFLGEALRTVPVVKWGFAAWTVLLWMTVSSLVPYRRWRYEFFVAQHIASAVVLLALLFLHVPAYHHFSVWCAFVAFAYDVVTRAANPAWRNLRLRLPAAAAVLGRATRYAFAADVQVVDEQLTAVTIRDVVFKWAPGQHVLIWSPTFPRQSPHPFTIVGVADPTLETQDLRLLIKAKRGFTRLLNEWAAPQLEEEEEEEQPQPQQTLRLLVAGPYGSTSRDWKSCTNLVLISGSTGGSFTTAVMGGILASRDAGQLECITAVYVVRRRQHGFWYVKRLASLLLTAKELGIRVNVEVAVTTAGGETETVITAVSRTVRRALKTGDDNDDGEDQGLIAGEEGEPLQDMSRGSSDESDYGALKEEMDAGVDDAPFDSMMASGLVKETSGRPNVNALIRREVDRATGSVGVAVCAGDGLERATRRAVASAAPSVSLSLSSGEQRDIWLHVERAGG